MDGQEQRAALEALITGGDTSLATLSRLLGRNAAWMQQYLRRGTPRLLPEVDRSTLARFFGVAESVLGGPVTRLVQVPRLEIAASAGPGRLVDREEAGALHYDPAELARLGVAPGDASEIAVSGDSMEPTLRDGDRILVDRGQRRVGARQAIWVIRLGDVLRVKRLVSDGASLRLVSDNAPEEVHPAATVEVVGRVVALRRAL